MLPNTQGEKVLSASAYIKSSYCGVASCVEVRLLADGRVGVRDSKDVSRPDLVFTQPEWRAFVAGVCDGEFDPTPA